MAFGVYFGEKDGCILKMKRPKPVNCVNNSVLSLLDRLLIIVICCINKVFSRHQSSLVAVTNVITLYCMYFGDLYRGAGTGRSGGQMTPRI